MKIKKPSPDWFSFQAARGVLQKFCFPKNLPDSGWCSHDIGEHFPINHQPRHSSLIKSLYGNSVARLISASVELKSVRNQIRKHLGNFFCYLLQSQFSYVSWKDQTETNQQVKNSHDNFYFLALIFLSYTPGLIGVLWKFSRRWALSDVESQTLSMASRL